MGKIKGAILTIILLFLTITPVYAEENGIVDADKGLRIEQTHAYMPTMQAYYYAEESGDDVTATFAGQEMQVSDIKPYDATQGMDYYFLIDISASIADSYFQDMKEGILQFQQSMNEKDTMTLLTFGDAVQVVFEKADKGQNIEDKINVLENKDMTTVLFQAIDKTAQLASADEDMMRRKIVVVFTDGEDYTENKTTNNEALDTLKKAGLCVYGYAVEQNKRGERNPYINEFGEFSRATGGYLTVLADGQTTEELSKLQNKLQGAKVLTLKAASNKSYQTLQPLTITVGDALTETVEVLADKAEKDTTKPETSVEQISNKSVAVTFSEPVQGAESKDNYVVQKIDDDSVLSIAMISYSESGKCQAILTFGDAFYNGDYEVSYRNITDQSAQMNAVDGTDNFTITDGLKEDSPFVKFVKAYWLYGLVILLVLVTAVIIIVIYLKIKKNKGVVMVDGTPVIGSQIEVKKHVDVIRDQVQGHEITFLVKNKQGLIQELPMLVSGSMIVGRSKEICDLSFQDEHLSSQHFAIEEGRDGFYIMDLETTNGTMVNGVRIHQKRKLQQGDTICAGMIEMQVRW